MALRAAVLSLPTVLDSQILFAVRSHADPDITDGAAQLDTIILAFNDPTCRAAVIAAIKKAVVANRSCSRRSGLDPPANLYRAGM